MAPRSISPHSQEAKAPSQEPSLSKAQARPSISPILEIKDLHIWFGSTEVVRGVSLTLHRGEVLGLVGESGSGKSVTSLAILGLLSPAAKIQGSIRWHGRELVGLPNRELQSIRGREIAIVFQEPMTALNPAMTIGKQIVEAMRAHSFEGDPKQQAIAALEAVSIPSASRRMNDYPHQFSGGQRQRILIAMALVHRPQLLIADEPTTALDVTVQAQVLDLLKGLQVMYGVSMIFTSHDLGVIGQMASRVAVMRSGQILETGPMIQVLTHPGHPYTQSLLDAVPTLRTDRAKPLAQVAAPQ